MHNLYLTGVVCSTHAGRWSRRRAVDWSVRTHTLAWERARLNCTDQEVHFEWSTSRSWAETTEYGDEAPRRHRRTLGVNCFVSRNEPQCPASYRPLHTTAANVQPSTI